MNSVFSSQEVEIWDLEFLTYDPSKGDSEGIYSPQTVFDYLFACCLVISDIEVSKKNEIRRSENREIVAQYKLNHACERCGTRSQNPYAFSFLKCISPRKIELV